MNQDQKHAIVTGGGSGIGAAIAHALLQQGMALTLLGRNLEKLQTTADSFSAAGRVCSVSADVTDPESVKAAFAFASAEFGPVDVLVNCAGAAPTKAFHKLSSEDWSQVMAVNLNGVFNCTSAVINAMRERKSGRIINIASTASLKGYAYVSAYCAAKHGVLGLTRALALETARHGITVNAVCPGYTDTDIIQNAIKHIVATTDRNEEQALAEFTQTNPQGRLIDPQEVASTVVWLCSESSRSVTGQAISISGGETM